MGLKLNRTTGLHRPLTIRDRFTVEVWHRTRTEQEQFYQDVRGLGDDEAAKRAAEFFLKVDECTGLTVPVLQYLRVPVADDQPTDEAGEIEIDAEVLGDVWRHAFPALFENVVVPFSSDMLSTVAKEKDRAKND